MNKRWAVVLAFCGVFVAGAVVGGLVAKRGSARPPLAKQRDVPPSTPASERFSAAIMKRYTARLDLDEGQRESLKAIVSASAAELRELHSHSFYETVAIGDRMNAQVATLLRPDQYERFEKLKEAVRNYWERERERRNGSTNSSAPQHNDDGHKPERREERAEPEESRKAEKSGQAEKPEKREDKRSAERKPEKEKRR